MDLSTNTRRAQALLNVLSLSIKGSLAPGTIQIVSFNSEAVGAVPNRFRRRPANVFRSRASFMLLISASILRLSSSLLWLLAFNSVTTSSTSVSVVSRRCVRACSASFSAVVSNDSVSSNANARANCSSTTALSCSSCGGGVYPDINGERGEWNLGHTNPTKASPRDIATWEDARMLSIVIDSGPYEQKPVPGTTRKLVSLWL
jgi:hypothetical protein